MSGRVDTPPSLIVVSGPPGAGKTTVAATLARRYARAVHLHTDDFWAWIVSGGIAPYEAAAAHQNHTVLDVVAGAAFTYAAGGFTTVVDGVVGPWTLDHVLDRACQHPDVPVHYVVLRPRREVTLARAQGRTADDALRDEGPVLAMWDQFTGLGALESHVVDTSDQEPAVTVQVVAAGVDDRRFLLCSPG